MERPRWERLLKFRCTGCGNCCKQTYICVTDTDVRRLMDGTGRRAEEIVRFAREDEINLGKHHPWWVRFATRRGVMVLRWKRGRCTFLEADNRCGVYAHRPLVCRLHPINVTLANDDSGAVEKLSLSRTTPCPKEWDGHQTRRDLGLLERLLWRESNAYIPQVEAWNAGRAGRRSVTEFLNFVFGSRTARPQSRSATTAVP